MSEYLLIISLVLLLIPIYVFIFLTIKRSKHTDPSYLSTRIDLFAKDQDRLKEIVRSEIALNREEYNKTARDQRHELSEQFNGFRSESLCGAVQLREEVISNLKNITDITTKTLGELSNNQNTQLDSMNKSIARLSETNENRFESLRVTIEAKLKGMVDENSRQLD